MSADGAVADVGGIRVVSDATLVDTRATWTGTGWWMGWVDAQGLGVAPIGADGAVGVITGPSADGGAPSGAPSDGGGCGCAAAGANNVSWSCSALALLALGLVARARRAPPHCDRVEHARGFVAKSRGRRL